VVGLVVGVGSEVDGDGVVVSLVLSSLSPEGCGDNGAWSRPGVDWGSNAATTVVEVPSTTVVPIVEVVDVVGSNVVGVVVDVTRVDEVLEAVGTTVVVGSSVVDVVDVVGVVVG
jgi:hypothetical protein